MNEEKDSNRSIQYAEKPVYFKQMFDQLGPHKMSELVGYAPNTVRQMSDGRMPVRKFVEFACQQYIEAQRRTDEGDKIFFFTSQLNSKEFIAIDAVAKAMGVTIQKL